MNWFTELTGLPDDRPETVRSGIVQQDDRLLMPNGRQLRPGHLTIPRLADLPRPSGAARPRLREVVADVRNLLADPANAGATFQVASQFNLLEMIRPDVTPEDGIARYETDRTQGPACAMACAAGTIWRNYLVPMHGSQIGQSADLQIDTTADLAAALGPDARWDMRNGYLWPRPGALQQVAVAIDGREAEFRGLLRVGIQDETEVTLPGAGHTVTQVYASALPVHYVGANLHWEPFARLILEAAYEATFLAAQMTADQTGNRRLYLTRLGGGAFGNRDEWIDAAILAALSRVPGLDLDIAIVSFGRSHAANRALVARA